VFSSILNPKQDFEPFNRVSTVKRRETDRQTDRRPRYAIIDRNSPLRVRSMRRKIFKIQLYLAILLQKKLPTWIEEDDRFETGHLDVVNADVTQNAYDVICYHGNQPSNGGVLSVA